MVQSSWPELFSMVDKLLSQPKCVYLVEIIWNFDYFAAATLFQTAPDALGPSGLTVYPAHRRRTSIARVRIFSTLQEVQKRGQCHHSRATGRGVIDKATPSRAVHKRMTGKYFIDVFGGFGFLSKATNHFGLRGHVLDMKFGPRYCVTQPLVPCSHPNSTGRLCWKMCRRSDFTHFHVQVLPSPTGFFVPACRGFWNTRVYRGCGTCPKSKLLRRRFARPLLWRIIAPLDLHAESEHCFWLETWTTEICAVLLANVLGQVDAAVCWDKTMFIQRLPHHAQSAILHVTTPALTVCLSRLP